MSVTNFKKVFIFRLEIFALIVVFLILLGLGRWQIHRAEEKKAILHAYELSQKTPELVWDVQQKDPSHFQKIKIHGKAGYQLFYLDNQFQGHQLGYEVFVPVELEANTVVLVDAGWLPIGRSRMNLPLFDLHELKVWKGRAYYPGAPKVDLGHFLDRKVHLRFVIERLDIQKIANILHKQVRPWVIKRSISKKTIVRVPPEKHDAYAFQWFVMAGLVLILLIWRVIKK